MRVGPLSSPPISPRPQEKATTNRCRYTSEAEWAQESAAKSGLAVVAGLSSPSHGPDLDRHLCLRLGVGRRDDQGVDAAPRYPSDPRVARPASFSHHQGTAERPLSIATPPSALGVGSAMSPPRWPGEPPHDCPKCCRIVGPLHMRTEHLKHVGWEPYQVVSYVNWCGHAQEIIPLPLPDG